MNLNTIPFAGWFLDFVLKVSLAIPFWFIWTILDIGKKYFSFLPEIYLSPSFWDTVGVFIVVPIAYSIFIPKIVGVSNNQVVKLREDDE
jgi:hypothetical protein